MDEKIVMVKLIALKENRNKDKKPHNNITNKQTTKTTTENRIKNTIKNHQI
jgi:hypothetical protein